MVLPLILPFRNYHHCLLVIGHCLADQCMILKIPYYLIDVNVELTLKNLQMFLFQDVLLTIDGTQHQTVEKWKMQLIFGKLTFIVVYL